MYPRFVQKNIEDALFNGKIVIIYGPRQVGKTTISKAILKNHQAEKDYINCEFLENQQALATTNSKSLYAFLGGRKLVVLDEAQRISDIGSKLKIMHDTYPEVQIIATGSSSFDLANKINEPLTGRAEEFIVYPISFKEVSALSSEVAAKAGLEKFLRFGMYPEIIPLPDFEAGTRLNTLVNQQLYKDVLAFDRVKKSVILTKLLQLLALQLGSEVSLNELAQNLKVSRSLVANYLDVLEQSFVIFRLQSFSRNLRKEIAKNFKIYFYDIGVRNALIHQYNSLDLRVDGGALWENFCLMERMKKNAYNKNFVNQYFWRTYDQKEIDYIEEGNGKLSAYEFKYSSIKQNKTAKEFLQMYKNSSFCIVTKDNFIDFV